ncbi:MAG: tyrosine-type recombinase/integrase [Chitinivibrionales bacterium]|nr:tyrosine-type recombinase/integrase [Chitinivibrionales bacterium]
MGIQQIKPGVFFLDVRAWSAGRQYRKREQFEGGNNAAKMRFFQIKKELQQRAQDEARSLTLSEFQTLNEVLDFYCQNNDLSKSRADCYFRRLREIGATPLYNLSRVFKDFIRLQKNDAAINTGKRLSCAAINKLKVFAMAALNYAVQEEKIPENPLKGIRKEKEKPREIVLTPEQEAELLRVTAQEAPDNLPYVQYCLVIPCRKGELVRAPKSFYNRFTNKITIPGIYTKNGRACVKPVFPGLVEYFRNIPEDCPWLFYRYEAGQYKPLGNIHKSFKRCASLAGMPWLRQHDLRHVAVLKLIEAGNPREWVMSVAGWASDMLKVYFNRPGDEAAALIRFPETVLTAVHFTGEKDKNAVSA